MNIFLIGLGILLVAEICIIIYNKDRLETLFIFNTCILIAYLVILLCIFCGFKSAEMKANIINKEFNTTYTAEELFWAEDVIDEVKQIKRQRIEANINLKEK